MIKNKISFFCLLLLLIAQLSCKSSKGGMSAADKKQMKNQLSELNFVEGNKHFILGNYQEAEASFQKAAEFTPENAAVNYMLSRTAFILNNNDKALSYITKAIKQDGKNKYYYLLEAQIYEKQLNYNEAAKVYKKLITEVPKSEEYNYHLAALYLYLNQPEEAIKAFDNLEKAIGKNPEVSQEKVQAYLKMNRLEDALAEARSLVEAFPDDPDYKIYQAEILFTNKRQDEALTIVHSVLKEYPENGRAILLLSEIYKSRGENSKAIELYVNFFRNPEADFNLKLRVLNDLEKSPTPEAGKKPLDLAKTLVQVHPDESEAYVAYADLLLESGNKEEALRNYILAKNHGNNKFSMWSTLLALEVELNKTDSLIKHSEKALEVFPNQSVIWYYNGIGWQKKEKYSNAAEAFEEGKKLAASNNLEKNQFLMLLADVYNSMQDYAKSDGAFEEILKSDPENAGALNNYSYYLSIRKEKLDRAKEMAEKVVKQHPEESTYLDTYGWVLYQMQDYNKAVEVLGKAAAKQDNGTILEHYGDALFRSGQKEVALEMWKKAKALGETSNKIDQKIRDKNIYE